MSYIYRKANLEDLNKIWDKDINNNSKTWIQWKKDFIEYNNQINVKHLLY